MLSTQGKYSTFRAPICSWFHWLFNNQVRLSSTASLVIPDPHWASQVALSVKNPPANAGDIRDVGQENPLEEDMATHSSILAWRNPWMEEPGGLQSIGMQRVRHD